MYSHYQDWKMKNFYKKLCVRGTILRSYTSVEDPEQPTEDEDDY